MAADNILRSYGDANSREDVVLNAIEILTATENKLLGLLGKTNAINTVHSFQVDELRTPASAAISEGGDYSYNGLTTPTRLTNICSLIAIPFSVTTTQQNIQKYSGTDELQRQTSKAMMDWGNAAEFDIVRSTLVSGASGTVPKMSGLIEFISKASNTTSHTSGTAFSATILDSLMEDNWNNSNGDVVTDILVGSKLKKAVDGFTQKSNIVVNNPGGLTTIVRTVTTYETSFGTVTFHKHRYIQQPGDATGRVLGLRPEKLKLAYLERPLIDDNIARSGPYTKRAVRGQFTVEVRNQDSNFFADGFNID